MLALKATHRSAHTEERIGLTVLVLAQERRGNSRLSSLFGVGLHNIHYRALKGSGSVWI